MAKLERDLTTGNVWKQLIIFAIPLFISNLIQSVYSVADLMVVSYFSGTASISGVNISSNVMIIVVNLAAGIANGGTVMIGRFLGAGQRENIKKSIGTLFVTLTVLALALTMVLIVFAHPIIQALNTPREAYSETYWYLIISASGTFFIFGYNALSAVMRGMGDGKTPLKFVIVASIVNIVLDLIFIRGFHWGAGGAAAATIIAQAVSMIACMWYLVKNQFIFDFKLSSFRFYKDYFLILMKVGLPGGAQMVATNISFLVLSALINEMGGVAASAAVGIVGKFNGFAILVQVAISSAVSAMISQNVGANNLKRTKQAVYYGLALCIAMSLVIFVFARTFSREIFALFNAEADVVEQGLIYMKSFTFEYIFLPFIVAFNAIFTGTGNGWITMINEITTGFLVRIPIAIYLGTTLGMGIFGVGCSVPGATFVGAMLATIFYLSGVWKRAFVASKEV